MQDTEAAMILVMFALALYITRNCKLYLLMKTKAISICNHSILEM